MPGIYDNCTQVGAGSVAVVAAGIYAFQIYALGTLKCPPLCDRCTAEALPGFQPCHEA